MEDKITQWVKDNAYGLPTTSLDIYIARDFAVFLREDHYDYFADLINESIEKCGCFDIFENMVVGDTGVIGVYSERKFSLKVFLGDLIKRIHDIEEQEEEIAEARKLIEQSEKMKNYIDSKSCDENFANGNKAGIRDDYDTGSDRLMKEHR